MSDITIRRATADDSRRLTRLVRGSRAYRGDYAAMVEGYQVGGSYIEHHPVFVAVDGGEGGSGSGKVLGFYALLVDGAGAGAGAGTGGEAELDLAFVADEAQGLGIGRLLMEHMAGQARAAGVGSVKVVAHPPAEEFYLRTGAVRTGTVPPSGHVHWERPELRYDVA
ncbi:MULTISPECIES: GNAT family N-acetyltransferase [unclassified Streptomyces]|uniref:GNAT family N-acetyltransferase n=1 Tax=unclassified Streptomyces TaxID=2593676 RepID=UPI0033B08460